MIAHSLKPVYQSFEDVKVFTLVAQKQDFLKDFACIPSLNNNINDIHLLAKKRSVIAVDDIKHKRLPYSSKLQITFIIVASVIVVKNI